MVTKKLEMSEPSCLTQTREPPEALLLTLDGREHSASHSQHESERAAEQEAVRHVKVEMARVHHEGGAAAAAGLHAVLHETGGGNMQAQNSGILQM